MNYDIVLPEYEVMPVALSNGQIRDWGHSYLKAQEFYGVSQGEQAVVFVLDTASQFTDHPDLVANCLPNLDKNFSNSPDGPDVHGHGTHCAGIVAASDNGIGVIGIAPKCKIVAIKVLNDSGSGSFGWVAQALAYVADLQITGTKIVSMSLGGPAGQEATTQLKTAIDYAISKNVIVIAAAGNSGYDGSRDTEGAPANYGPVIAVASTQQPGNSRSGFSSGGSKTDIAAPGSTIYSTHKDGGYARLSGTSMACPQVAGIAALLVTQHPALGQQSVFEAYMKEHATDILSPGRDNESGYGVPILTNFIGKTPGGTPPPPPNPEPEPEPTPELPIRKLATTKYDLEDMQMVSLYRINATGETQNAIVSGLVVSVESNVKTEEIGRILRDYVKGYYAGRMLVLEEGSDLREVAIYNGVFMQFIADDDWVQERFGTRLKLKVEKMHVATHEGSTVIVVNQSDVQARQQEVLKSYIAGAVYSVEL